MMDSMDRMMDSMMGGMGLFMLLGIVLIAIVIGTAIYLAIRAGSATRQQVEGPRELLERRLASGEITPEEYYERESALPRGEPTISKRSRS